RAPVNATSTALAVTKPSATRVAVRRSRHARYSSTTASGKSAVGLAYRARAASPPAASARLQAGPATRTANAVSATASMSTRATGAHDRTGKSARNDDASASAVARDARARHATAAAKASAATIFTARSGKNSASPLPSATTRYASGG